MKVLHKAYKEEASNVGYQIVYELYEFMNKVSTRPVTAGMMK